MQMMRTTDEGRETFPLLRLRGGVRVKKDGRIEVEREGASSHDESSLTSSSSCSDNILFEKPTHHRTSTGGVEGKGGGQKGEKVDKYKEKSSDHERGASDSEEDERIEGEEEDGQTPEIEFARSRAKRMGKREGSDAPDDEAWYKVGGGGEAAGVGGQGESEGAVGAPCFDGSHLGAGMELRDGGRTLIKVNETWVKGETLGYGAGLWYTGVW